MTRFRFAWMVVALALALVPTRAIRAADPIDDGIAPFLDEDTFLVVRLDVEKVDQEALVKYAEDSFGKMMKVLPIPAEAQGEVKGQMMGALTTARTFLNDIAKAGGKKIYLLMDMADFTAGVDEPVVVVPLQAGAEADGVMEVLRRNNTEADDVEEIGKAVVFAKSTARTRLKNVAGAAKAVDVPNIAKALAGAGDAPLRVAFAPSDKSRTWMQSNLPPLPDALAADIDAKTLLDSIDYASIAVVQKPAHVMNLALKCKDAEKAKQLSDVAAKALEATKAKVPQGKNADNSKKVLDKLKPALKNDTLTLSVDPFDVALMTGERRSEVEVDGNDPNGKAAPAEKKKDDGGL